jgi:hypothetical protein
MGLCSLADTYIANRLWDDLRNINYGGAIEPYPFGNGCLSNVNPTRVAVAFGGAGSGQHAEGACGFGAGAGAVTNGGFGSSGVLGGMGAILNSLSSAAGFGGGAGGVNGGSSAGGGAAVVIFIY